MNLREWALAQGVHPQTAYKWFREGRLPVSATRVGGVILVGDLADLAASRPARTVLYARVCSSDQSDDLDRQVVRLTKWATEHGRTIGGVVTEVGSGLNGSRKRLLRTLGDPMVTEVVVEHRDRLSRFGFDYIDAALSAQGRSVTVVETGEVEDDLVRDIIDVLTSMCAGRYGRRSARSRAQKAARMMTEGGA